MTTDDIARTGGFSDAEDMEERIRRVDRTTPLNPARFNQWLANAGTKAGLLRLPRGKWRIKGR